MSSTPTPQPDPDQQPDTDAQPTEDAAAPTADAPAPAPAETGTAAPVSPAPARPDAEAEHPTTASTGTAPRSATSAPISTPSPDTPGRGAHLQSRRAPVAPAPDPDEDDLPVTPRLATAADSAPTTALPAIDDPLGTGPHAVSSTAEPSGPIRRTSFRTELDTGATAAAAPFAATPPPAPPYELDLPGTGPADDQVPPGDASVTSPEHTLPPFPVTVPQDPSPVAPVAPRSRGGIGRMLLGMLIGLVSGALGSWLVLFGQSRILGVQAPGWDASYDPLGVVLVTVGVLLLAALVGVGTWSSAAPFTAGLLATVIGVVYLYVPATTHADTVSWVATDYTRGSVERTVVATTSGTLFVIGGLLLAVGIAFTALNRRRMPRI